MEPVATVEPVAASGESGIVVNDVWRFFGDVPALAGMSFTAPYGQVTALVGPNGAGKTTLLLVLASLLKPSRGAVRVAGEDPVRKPRAVRAMTGWMPDAFGVYDQLTVNEYLTFFGRAYGLDRDTTADRTMQLLDLVHLVEYINRPVHVLSRGQKQRLALTRALIHHPRVLLLDEPASGLDPRSRVELRDMVRGLAASGVAVLISSHILTELEEIADRVVLVSRGRTIGEHTMRELSAHAIRGYRVRALDPPALANALRERRITHSIVEDAAEVPGLTQEQAAGLLAALVGAGVPVMAFEPLGSNLEALYMSMTEERL